MYLQKFDVGIQALHQRIYDGWFKLTGNTNFGLSRGCFTFSVIAWFGAVFLGRFDLYSCVTFFGTFCLGISLVWHWNKVESCWSYYLDNPALNIFGSFMPWGLIRLWLVVVLIAHITAMVMGVTPVGVSLLLCGRDVLLTSMFYFAACTPREAVREVPRHSYAQK